MDSSKKPERKSPRENSFFLSQLIFGWILPIMFKGARKGLTQDDLTKCLQNDESDALGTVLEREWEKELDKSRKRDREPKLQKALFRMFWRSCITDGLLTFLFVLLKSLQPVVLAQMLIQFEKPQQKVMINSTLSDDYIEVTDQDLAPAPGWGDLEDFIFAAWNDVYWLAGLLVAMILLGCFAVNHSDLRQRLVGARMRIACCSVIYRKTLRMSKKAAGRTPAGYLVNLLSNDVSRLDYGFIYAHYIWILPIQSVLICYLIWREVGIAAFVGVIGLLLKTIPVQTGLSKLSAILRERVAKCTDERVGIMNELIQGIQVIKMYAWEIPFQKVVATARKKEIKEIRYASYIRGIYLSTMVFTERSTLLIAVVTCVFTNQMITADVVFSMAQFFNILQLVAAIFYPLAVSFGAEALVSVRRVQDYLMIEEQDETNTGLHRIPTNEPGKPDIVMNEVVAKWDQFATIPTLRDISIKVPRGSLCAIIGPVGAGKSSLLQLLLGELPIFSGTVHIADSISYASQEPWLFTGTVRNNILFGLPYNRKRYRDVVQHCALLTDFEQLPNGDQTIVGERGASLSGGQKARVSLARAVYKEAQVYLLDDPLSAVDAHVGKHLFDECIGPKGYLSDQKTTRVLVTHQVHFLTEADWIVVLEDGKILMQGTYADLANSALDFGKLLQPPEPKEEVYDDSDDIEDDIPYIDGVSKDGYQALGSTASLAKSRSFSRSMSLGMSMTSNLGGVGQIESEEQAEGSVPLRVWRKYFLAGANICVLIAMVVVLLSSQVVTSGSDYFMNFWTNQEHLRYNNQTTIFTTYECLYCYTGLIVAVILMTIMRGWLYFNICMRASVNLHNRMFACLLRAPMAFFDTNPSGRILNRFSKDMGAIDELLPRAMMESIQNLLVMVGILVVIMIVNPMLMIPLIVAAFLFVLVLNLYLRPAQDWKRLEGICRSPVFSHLSATLNGLSTIRANSAQEKLATEFDGLQDVHSSVWHLTMSSNTALGLWLDVISAGFIACVAYSFIAFSDNTFSGSVGLAISQALILTGMVQYGIRQSTESIQQMTCVERVIQYSDIEPEANPTKKAPLDWPWKGEVEFRNMSLAYGKSEPVLKNLHFLIRPAWKVGVVGRTGAGKSSLISALFRLANIEGKVLVDGIDTSVISLDTLRSKISIIPQDPVLFSATIRYNLDPFNMYEDADIWRALEAVELKTSIPGLHHMVTEGGTNFSVGQRQLICLARAILRQNLILVLDEATANVDPQTDKLIQETIRHKFHHCTVLTVAHRLHTVMDSDRILVMEAGIAKEFDIPHNLLENEHGILRSMVDATGAQEAASLKEIAAQTFNRMQNSGSVFR